MYAARLTRRAPRTLVLRHFSTPSTSTQPKKPPSAIPPGSKPTPKVKLQPAPVKPTSLAPNPASSSSQLNKASPPKSKPVSKSPPSTISEQVTPTSSKSSWNLVETFRVTKQQTLDDLESAYEEGIFAPRPEGAGNMRKGLHTAWEMGKFYFFGITTIFSRQRDCFRIWRRTRKGDESLTRAEYRMIAVQKQDVQKVIPFFFVALILEEAIPFIAILAPGTLPSTWLLPSQSRRVSMQKDLKAADANGLAWTQVREEGKASEIFCSLFRLSTAGFNFMMNHRLTKHIRFLAQDDRLLRQEDNASHLTASQVDEALRERGFLLSQIPAGERLIRLQKWLQRTDGSPDETRRLTQVVEGH
ncbi:hypothetical protein DL96DRAFT_1709796 [Flagelloscypha sp. PMI_526]|nr:hypothetical protein DL96DRAFT_1709796 [Flagelloscypha sp. PMI_526]